MSFCFVTDQGIHYDIGFYADRYFMPNEAYHFYIDNSQHEHGTYDPKIYEVVVTIIEHFFNQEPSVMLYVCDPVDKRQAARNRLYNIWFYDYALNHEMTLYSDAITYKDVTYYAGILLKHTHPKHDKILSDYQDFLKTVTERYVINTKD